MTQTTTVQHPDQGEILRVFQSKAETKAFYDKISGVYDLLAEHSEGSDRHWHVRQMTTNPESRSLVPNGRCRSATLGKMAAPATPLNRCT